VPPKGAPGNPIGAHFATVESRLARDFSMTPQQHSLLRELVQDRGHADLTAFTKAVRIPRITLYRVAGGAARDASVKKVAKALGIPVRDLRAIIEIGARR